METCRVNFASPSAHIPTRSLRQLGIRVRIFRLYPRLKLTLPPESLRRRLERRRAERACRRSATPAVLNQRVAIGPLILRGILARRPPAQVGSQQLCLGSGRAIDGHISRTSSEGSCVPGWLGFALGAVLVHEQGGGDMPQVMKTQSDSSVGVCQAALSDYWLPDAVPDVRRRFNLALAVWEHQPQVAARAFWLPLLQYLN